MYRIVLNIKHKEVYDRMVKDAQEAISEDEQDSGKTTIENIQIGETESSAEINLPYNKLLGEDEEEETTETVAPHQEA